MRRLKSVTFDGMFSVDSSACGAFQPKKRTGNWGAIVKGIKKCQPRLNSYLCNQRANELFDNMPILPNPVTNENPLACEPLSVSLLFPSINIDPFSTKNDYWAACSPAGHYSVSRKELSYHSDAFLAGMDAIVTRLEQEAGDRVNPRPRNPFRFIETKTVAERDRRATQPYFFDQGNACESRLFGD